MRKTLPPHLAWLLLLSLLFVPATAFGPLAAQASAADTQSPRTKAPATDEPESDAPAQDADAKKADKADADKGGADKDPAANKDDVNKNEAAGDEQFVRVRRDGKGKPLSLETALVRYEGSGEHAGVRVDLVGAIHVGEKTYYEELNRLFTEYDVLLFELVAPEGIQIKPGDRLQSQNAVGALQNGLKNFLGLEFQLEQVDYAQPNFVHADMSPEQFAETMKARGESFFQMLLKMLSHGVAVQNAKAAPVSDAELIVALLRRDRTTLKRVLAEQLENMEGALNVLGGADGASTIITERNKKALQVMQREIGNGKKRIGIFYGAGHLPDLDERLRNNFGMKQTGKQWLSAWDLTTDHSQPARPK